MKNKSVAMVGNTEAVLARDSVYQDNVRALDLKVDDFEFQVGGLDPDYDALRKMQFNNVHRWLIRAALRRARKSFERGHGGFNTIGACWDRKA